MGGVFLVYKPMFLWLLVSVCLWVLSVSLTYVWIKKFKFLFLQTSTNKDFPSFPTNHSWVPHLEAPERFRIFNGLLFSLCCTLLINFDGFPLPSPVPAPAALLQAVCVCTLIDIRWLPCVSGDTTQPWCAHLWTSGDLPGSQGDATVVFLRLE